MSDPLSMLDDYFFARVPQRKVYYINVGNMPHDEALASLTKLKEQFKDKKIEPFRNESDQEFTDISSEASRTYNFGQKGFVKIANPLFLNVSASGGHRIFSADGQSHYIPSGWIHLSWTVHEGQPNFVK